MNDFTKQQLKYLANILGCVIDCGLTGYDDEMGKEILRELYDKFESMIDNYCEHEHDLDNYDEFACKKCGIKLD